MKRREKRCRVPGAAQHGAQRSGALQTPDRSGPLRSRISGAPLHSVPRCTASGTREIGRREFIAFIGIAAAPSLLWPFAAWAQQPMPVIGFLSARSPAESAQHLAAFQRGLNDAGYVEGQNVAIEYRWAEGQYDRLPTLASELIARQVTVIAAIADPSPQIAKSATRTTPIVFAINGDPVGDGLVATLNRPDGNATGITIFGPAAVSKRLQLLHELVPQASTIAYLMNPNNPNGDVETSEARIAARSLGREMVVLGAGSEPELDAALTIMSQRGAAALLLASDPFFVSRRDQLVSLVARHRLPAIYYLREFAEAGGLISYGNRLADVYRLVGIYVGRILKGEKPADLPVQQSTKFELVINLKTAKALGLSVPLTLQASADEVIE
jgi:putative tryptophan/tyrosine transport system substrate-binding protein